MLIHSRWMDLSIGSNVFFLYIYIVCLEAFKASKRMCHAVASALIDCLLWTFRRNSIAICQQWPTLRHSPLSKCKTTHPHGVTVCAFRNEIPTRLAIREQNGKLVNHKFPSIESGQDKWTSPWIIEFRLFEDVINTPPIGPRQQNRRSASPHAS